MAQLHHLPAKGETSPDPIFFAKHQLRVGTVLRYVGRRNSGSRWYVIRVTTFKWEKGRGRTYFSTFPETFSDVIELRNHQTGEMRELNFGYLSYSAIWRIED